MPPTRRTELTAKHPNGTERRSGAPPSKAPWRRGLLGAALFATAACGAPTAADDVAGSGVTVETDGALHGRLERLIADHEDGTSTSFYFLHRADGSSTRLIFDNDPGLPSDLAVAVSGHVDGDTFVVSSLREEVAAAIPRGLERQTGAITNAPPDKARKFAFVLLDTGTGVNLTAAQARQRMFDLDFYMPGQGSIRRYYQEESYGVTDIVGDVYGPIAFSPASTCDTKGASNLRTMIDQMAGGASDHYLWYFGSKQSGCSWAGLASVGSPDRPSKDTWYNASAGCVVLVQEPGHNFGMQHSSSMSCPGAAFVDAPDGTCKHNEYGDTFDPMGGGCRHMNAWQKVYQGWMGGCNSVSVTASGTFNLVPLEAACNGIQVLKIPMPKARTFSRSGGGGSPSTDTLDSYFLELRAPLGFDQSMKASVLVHVGSSYANSTKIGKHTWLLDMVPSTTSVNDAAMPAGMTFKDPAGGVSFTVVSVSNTGASIKVDFDGGGSGAPTCLDGSTLVGAGPMVCDGALTGGGSTAGTGGASGTGGGSGTGGARTGGTTGAGGTSATGGIAGGGRSGTGGTATGGNRGGAGNAGSAGRGGSGTGGSSVGGKSGTGGVSNAGGTTGSGGTGGRDVSGSTPDAGTRDGGNAVDSSVSNGPVPTNSLSGGCSCAIEGTGETSTTSSLVLLAAGALLTRRRRTKGAGRA